MSAARPVLLVTGQSGAGKGSILRVLEDLGYEAVDNAPVRLAEEMIASAASAVSGGERPMALGIDARSRGFDPQALLDLRERLRLNPAVDVQLVFATAEESVLLRRFTETRRRHPLSPGGRVSDGLAAEQILLAPLRIAADQLLDTTDLPLPDLRRVVELRFGLAQGANGALWRGMTLLLTSFAYPAGLPRDADLVLDARFLKNPHYDPILRPMTGCDPEVAAYVRGDPDYSPFIEKVTELLNLLLPRFRLEGKKYACLAVGCTGGRHRSVTVIEDLAARLSAARAPASQENPGMAPIATPGSADVAEGGASEWRVSVSHRELLREVVRNPDGWVTPLSSESAPHSGGSGK